MILFISSRFANTIVLYLHKFTPILPYTYANCLVSFGMILYDPALFISDEKRKGTVRNWLRQGKSVEDSDTLLHTANTQHTSSFFSTLKSVLNAYSLRWKCERRNLRRFDTEFSTIITIVETKSAPLRLLFDAGANAWWCDVSLFEIGCRKFSLRVLEFLNEFDFCFAFVAVRNLFPINISFQDFLYTALCIQEDKFGREFSKIVHHGRYIPVP